jgi:hypothetical protein
MEKKVLNEINRVREIMGLQIISEDSLPSSLTQKLLKTLFNVDAIKNIDPRTLSNVVTRSISRAGGEVTTRTLQDILIAIRNADWGNSILDDIPFSILFKELLQNSNKQVRSEMKASIRQSLKLIYPELDELATKSEQVLKRLTPTLASQDDVLYNDVLTQLRSLKKTLEGLNIDKEYKKLLIDAYKLNDLPLNADTAENIILNKNILKEKISELFLSKLDTKRGTTDIETGGITVTPAELKELEDFRDGKINDIEDLSEPLFNKILPVLKKNEDFINTYFDNVLLKLGFKDLKNEASLDDFQKYIMKNSSKNRTWKSVVEDEISNIDNLILGDKIAKEFKSVDATLKLASMVDSYPDQTIAQKLKKIYYESILPVMKELGTVPLLDNIKYLNDNFINRTKLMTPFGTVKEVQDKLDKEITLMAKRIAEGKGSIDGNAETIKNYLVLLQKSDLNEKLAEEWVTDKLLKSGITSEKFKKLIESPEWKELVSNLGGTLRENWTKVWGYMLRGTGEMSIIFNIRRWRELLESKPGAERRLTIVNFAGDFLKSSVRFALTTNPNSVATFRNILALTGRSGIWVDRGINMLLWRILVYPTLASIVEGLITNNSDIEMYNNFKKYHKLLCEPVTYEGETIEKIGTDEECKELSEILGRITAPLSKDEIKSKYLPTTTQGILEGFGIVTDTYVDDILNGLSYLENKVFNERKGTSELTDDILKKMQEELNSKKDKYDNKLRDEYCYNSDNGKDPAVNMFNCLKDRKKQKQGEKTVEGKYTDDKLGFNNFASKNSFTVVGEYNQEDGKGTVKLPDGTQAEYFWNETEETFEPN